MTGIGGAAHAAPNLPTIDLIDRRAVALDIWEPCWLYVGRVTELGDTGLSWRFVYRTTFDLPTTMYQQLLNLLDEATVIDSKIVADPGMMFSTGELSLWELTR